jgi:predicted GNAT family acetyltransferase
LSQTVLDGGQSRCFLFTDLDNPTSNAIYPRVGYEPVADIVEYSFGPSEPPPS